MKTLITRLRTSAAGARRLAPLPFQLIWTTWRFRHLDRVGRWTRAIGGSPLVDAEGTITIGKRGVANSRYAPVALRAAPGGTLDIGDRAVINFGTALSAGHKVSIGDDVTIGPYCIVDDRVLGAATNEQECEPITIGDGCWLASRVTVLPGTTIGAGTVIGAGSIVSGDIPARVVFGGAPARVLRQLPPLPAEHAETGDGAG